MTSGTGCAELVFRPNAVLAYDSVGFPIGTIGLRSLGAQSCGAQQKTEAKVTGEPDVCRVTQARQHPEFGRRRRPVCALPNSMFRGRRGYAQWTEYRAVVGEGKRPMVRRLMHLSTIGLRLVTAWILWALARGKGC